MNALQSSRDDHTSGRSTGTAALGVPGWLVVLLATASGMTVANLYYAQPLLSSLRDVFHVGETAAGGLITLTQVGYVLGMLLLVPLGDRLEKRRLITVLLTVTTLALLAAGLATSFPMLLVASLISGGTSVVAQILVPFAASLAPDHTRGRIVGRVMSGLLTGILLSRTLSSLVSDVAGWRVVYLGSAVLMALLAVALHAALPRQAATTAIPYTQVLRSTVRLVRVHPALMRRGLYQAAMFGAFSAFWTTVSYVLTGPRFHYSPVGVGVFALVGAAGAAVAPFAGRWADRKLVRPMTGAGLVAAAVAFAVAGLGEEHPSAGPGRRAPRHGRADHADPRSAHRLPARRERAGAAEQCLHRPLLRRRRPRFAVRFARLPRRRLDGGVSPRHGAPRPGPPLLGHGVPRPGRGGRKRMS